MTSVSDAYNYRKIDDLVSTSGVVTEAQLNRLSAEGYEVVVNLLPADSDYAVKNEASLVEDQGLAYFHIPVNFANPTRSDFETFCDVMSQNAGKKVHAHCAANFRVSAFYSLYAIQHLGWTESDLNELIGGLWKPEDNPPWDQFIATQLSGDKR